MSNKLLKQMIEQVIAGNKEAAGTTFHRYLTKKMGSVVAEGAEGQPTIYVSEFKYEWTPKGRVSKIRDVGQFNSIGEASRAVGGEFEDGSWSDPDGGIWSYKPANTGSKHGGTVFLATINRFPAPRDLERLNNDGDWPTVSDDFDSGPVIEFREGEELFMITDLDENLTQEQFNGILRKYLPRNFVDNILPDIPGEGVVVSGSELSDHPCYPPQFIGPLSQYIKMLKSEYREAN